MKPTEFPLSNLDFLDSEPEEGEIGERKEEINSEPQDGEIVEHEEETNSEHEDHPSPAKDT